MAYDLDATITVLTEFKDSILKTERLRILGRLMDLKKTYTLPDQAQDLMLDILSDETEKKGEAAL